MPKNRVYQLSDGRKGYSATDQSGKEHKLRQRKNEGVNAFKKRCDELDRICELPSDMNDVIFGELYKEWSEQILIHSSIAHQQSINFHYQNHIKKKFGHLKLSKITKSTVSKFLQAKANEGYSKSSISKIRTAIQSPYAWAVSNGGWHTNPVEGIRTKHSKPKTEKANKAITDDELFRFFEAAQTTKYRYLFALMLETGLRPSEALNLKWRDVKDNRLLVDGGITRYETSDGKTDAANRIIPLSESARSVIAKINNTSEWLFPCATQEPSMQALESAFDRALRKTSITLPKKRGEPRVVIGEPIKITMYSFRHTFATRCARAGMNPPVLMYLMGHKDIKTTYQYYTDVESEDLDIASQIIDSLNLEKFAFGTKFGTNSENVSKP